MRLYSTTGATQVDDPVHGTFKPDADGAFDGLPDAMYADLHGRPGWENDAERVARITAEQQEKLRDPATMLAELQKMNSGQGALTALLANALGLGKSAPEPTAPEPVEAPSGPTETDEPAPDTAPDSAPQDTATRADTQEKPTGRSSRAAKKTTPPPAT